MNLIFEPYLRNFVIFFPMTFWSIVPIMESRLQHLEVVFRCLLDNEFCLKESKCFFAQHSIEYLGHIVSSMGVGLDQTKISVLINWPPPKNVKKSHNFLGITGFYRKFFQNYSTLASHLTTLLKHDAFVSSDATQRVFNLLKSSMSKAPIFALPKFVISLSSKLMPLNLKRATYLLL